MPHNSEYDNVKKHISSHEQFWIFRLQQVLADRKELERRIAVLTKAGDEMMNDLSDAHPSVKSWHKAKANQRPTSIPDENE